MKIRVTISIVLLTTMMFFWGCSKETIAPTLTGSIQGQVLNNASGDPIAGASITTNPGTSAILTDKDGKFEISDVPTGNFTIEAEKKDFKSNTVRVTVAQDKVATANILLETKGASGKNILDAEVTNFFNSSSNDSSFVDINYRVKNTSNEMVSKFEVTFKIFTPTKTFFSQIHGNSLDIGQEAVGDTTQFIHQSAADSVTVSDVYTPSS